MIGSFYCWNVFGIFRDNLIGLKISYTFANEFITIFNLNTYLTNKKK